MRLPLNWVRDYADIVTTPHEYAEKMTMSGSKVEGYTCEADGIEKVVIGRILKLERHPDSDHLWVCAVDVGQTAPLTIVTGAQNLKEGDLCPVALDGSTLPGGVKIRRGKLRGVESCGMLCSLGELGLTTHDFPCAVEDGIMVLDEEVPVGTDAVKALGMDDVSVEFEITPNRPDCLSIRGLARESAATYGVPFRDHVPAAPGGEGDIRDWLSVEITAPTCSRYVAAMVTNVRVAPSPRWLRERLRLCGVRPINNIVDITNYVMLEYGHPMHAFDHAYVGGRQIHVRMAREGEKIVTLDGVERPLDATMMVIADDKVPMAVAGVMGGEFSGIYDSTKTIVFEGACFDGPSVRVTAKKVGLRTEASGRFEKGLNPENCLPAIQRALELVVQLDAGDVIGGIIDVYPQPRAERRIPLRPGAINRLLGTEVPVEQMIAILKPLGFGIEKKPLTALVEHEESPYVVVVPPERYDVERDCDIAEEICRYVGYNRVPSTIMKGVATARPSELQTFRSRMIEALVGYGLYECETFSFYGKKAFDNINLPADDPLRRGVVISNPLGEDTSIMRTTAVPSLLEVVARNYNARAAEVAVFENATEYLPAGDPEKLPVENEKLILAVYGPGRDYLSLKGIVEQLLETARITGVTVTPNTEGTTYHPGRAAWLMLGDEKLAVIGELHPKVLANYGLKPRVCVADIDLDLLFAHRGPMPEFRPLPKHPAITRDLALVAGEEVPAAEIAARIEQGAGKLLESLSLFDIYRGENIGAGKKSLAYSLVLRTADRTLTDEEADKAVARVLKNLEQLGVVLRS
ncbi:phenylalanine--tRNA ligase subunit beta [Anaerofilum sp. BX8]|uniref:Phenylalanine--tRNA ligase beta subunit n=1 Tax=Anaerofilum hominis TaxID=2763016 RepID=A0A923I8S0_9FIRM|nr:phenylalanine--tRNA ligase subunit beta [Anaerofilum hominis]MBC5580348.1 phenylalanine--tRNA ligase subunit beta [Anaerofilum hominis]